MNKIYITDNLRMFKGDERNIILERLTPGVNPKTKERTSSWKIAGYFRSYYHALKHVVNNDLAIDEEDIENLEQYLEDLIRVRDITKNLIDDLKTKEDEF